MSEISTTGGAQLAAGVAQPQIRDRDRSETGDLPISVVGVLFGLSAMEVRQFDACALQVCATCSTISNMHTHTQTHTALNHFDWFCRGTVAVMFVESWRMAVL